MSAKGWATVLLLAVVGRLGAAEPMNYDQWRKIAVLEDGRVKPFDTLAWEFVSTVTGRASLTPHSFAPITAGDVKDWSTLGKELSGATDSTPKALIAKLFGPSLAEELAKADFSTLPALEQQRDDAEKKLKAWQTEISEATGEAIPLEKVGAEAKGAHPDAPDVAATFEKTGKEIDQLRGLQARAIRALNGVLASPEFDRASNGPQGSIPGPLAERLEKEAKTLPPRELASLRRSLVQAALHDSLKGFTPAKGATVEDRKYDAVELYVTWLMTWQGWDKLKDFSQLVGERRDDQTYWSFHQPDAWDDLPMIDARFQALAPLLCPETAEAISPRALRDNKAFTQFVMRVQEQGGDEEPHPVEKHALETFRSYVGFTQARLGSKLFIGANPTSSVNDDHQWLPLVLLIVDNDRIEKFGLDRSAVERARSGFLEARAGFLSGDPVRFNQGSKTFAEALESLGKRSAIYPTPAQIDLEVGYNKLKPFLWTAVLSIAATVVLTLSLGTTMRAPLWLGYGLLLSAMGMSAYGLYLRVMISGRAPVTNMYETIIWSSLVASVIATALGSLYRQRIIPMTAALVLALATLLAYNMPINFGASISPLQPVLRKNYWLVIHVLTIVASYGAFMLAWALGNVGLFHYLIGKNRRETIQPIATFAYRSIQVGFLLLAAGTILGGWWAADSWGRFWGWDPKETWALIALLGYAVILHARFAGLIHLFGLLAGSVLAFSGVVMAWYGVNFVLGAGLHAYAFGTGGITYVGSAIAANILFVAAAYVAHSRRSPIAGTTPRMGNEVVAVSTPEPFASAS